MEKLVRGVEAFQQLRPAYQELFDEFKFGQAPQTLFITCADSRINPNLLTQTEPGEMFILRNAGNIVPPYGSANGGEGATIEYAVVALGIKDILVCGHSYCGAMGGLLHPETMGRMPLMAQWLEHAAATQAIMTHNYQGLDDAQRLMVTVEENVLVQLDHLRTYPCVAVGLARGDLRIHGWVYEVDGGEVFAYDTDSGQFVPLRDASLNSPIQRRLSRVKDR